MDKKSDAVQPGITTHSATLLLRDCPTGGCGAKIGASELSRFLDALPRAYDENLLVGYEGRDDAAVYALDKENAVVSTVDFFPPIVDDPRLFGRIAAANAVSDIYAMGGRPLFALNLVCFPESMDKNILGEILSGGAEKILEAGAVVAGGHSIYSAGVTYGLAVTGKVRREKVRRNNTCQAGDCLILTKPLGTGLVLSAYRAGVAGEKDVAAAVASMERLNRYAAEKVESAPVHAATDVTGFGLMGHCLEMAGTDWTLSLDFDSLPLLPGAEGYAAQYLATAAGQRNRNHCGGQVELRGLSPAKQEILFDPQTSGGLLLSVPMSEGEVLCRAIRHDDPDAAIIGEVTKREQHAVVVV